MGAKGVVFALIAAAISGIVGEGVERGLNAADEKYQKWRAGKGEETGTEDDIEDEDTEP